MIVKFKVQSDRRGLLFKVKHKHIGENMACIKTDSQTGSPDKGHHRLLGNHEKSKVSRSGPLPINSFSNHPFSHPVPVFSQVRRWQHANPAPAGPLRSQFCPWDTSPSSSPVAHLPYTRPPSAGPAGGGEHSGVLGGLKKSRWWW